MDSSFASDKSMESPNTIEWKRYRYCTGLYTDEERDFLVRKGLIRQDENGDYHELSTLVDSDFGDITSDDEETTAADKDPAENLRDVQSDDQGIDKHEGEHVAPKDDPEMEEIDELLSFSDRESDKLPPLEAPEVEELKSPDVSEVINVEQECNLTTLSLKEFLENEASCANTTRDEKIELDQQAQGPDDASGIIAEVLPAVVIFAEDKSIEEELVVAAGVPGIEDMSPANVEDDEISSHNNTTDSFADISLDAISDGSFNVELSDDGAGDEKPAFDESFKTCDSAASTASFRSCKDKQETAKSPEELDDTITWMEKVLKMADEQEAKEQMEQNNADVSGDITEGESFRNIFQTPMKSSPPPQLSHDTDHELSLSSPALFATPRAPVRRSKRISLSSMDAFLSPTKGASSPQKGKPGTPSPLSTKGSPQTRASPKQKSPLTKLPPKDKVGQLSPRPKPAVQTNRLFSILDSPAARIPCVPAAKLTTPFRLQKTPEKKLSAMGHPITSPVANYIYSLPPPSQIKRMAPPPVVPHQMSPKSTEFESIEEIPPAERTTKIPKPKSSLPVRYLGTLTESGDNVRKGQEYGSSIFAGSLQKDFTPTHYVGSDGVRPVHAIPSTVGDPTYPPRFPQGARNAQGITPVSHRHLGKRDSKNASMVAESNVERKFCPPLSRFGFRSKPQ